MDDLAVAFAFAFDENVAIDVGGSVSGIVDELGVITINKIELAIAIFDPVVSDDSASRAVFEVVAQTAFAEWSKAVELKNDAIRFGVVVVFVDAVFDAIVVNVTVFDEDVAGFAGCKQAIATIAEYTVANGDVLAFFDKDGGTVSGIWGLPVATGKGVRWAARTDVEVFDGDVRRHGIGGCIGPADFYNASTFIPVVELVAGAGVLAVDDGELACFVWYATNDDGVIFCALNAEDPFFMIGF